MNYYSKYLKYKSKYLVLKKFFCQEVPEIIIPTENLNFIEPYVVNDLDLVRMIGGGYEERTGGREYEFEMTHLLFEKNHRLLNRYVLSALYYYTPEDRENKEMIIDALDNYYRGKIANKLDQGFLEDNADIVLWREKLRMLSSPDFLTTPKYIRVGKLEIQTLEDNKFIIHHINAWIMRPGSGLQMICSLLRIFLNEFNTIFLTPETFAVKNYWTKLGFKHNNINNGESMINDDIISIFEKCVPLPPNVELILKFTFDGNEHYTRNLERVKELVRTIDPPSRGRYVPSFVSSSL